jgi:DNA-binding CsgD family transcriptional regulator
MVEGGDGSGGNEAIAAARRRWLDDLVAALPAFEVFGRAMVVIDLGDESIIGATASARALIDGPLPATAADLVEIGLVARPDLGRVRDHIVAWRKLDDLEHTAQESSHGWTDTIRLHRRGAPAVMAKLEITVHRRIDLGADAVVLTLWTDQDEPEPISSDQVEGFEEIWSLYDLDDRMVAVQASVAVHGIDPASRLGTMGWLYVHPEDLPDALAAVTQLREGRASMVRYAGRIRAHNGRWLPCDIESRRMVSASGPLVLSVIRYVNEQRRTMPPDLLTPREREVVASLFDGLRPAQIAERHGVAVKTVRNHLAASYRKLGVDGQAELLSTYHPPSRTTAPA